MTRGVLTELKGKKFNRLSVVKLGPKIGNYTAWYCKCDCGRTKLIKSYELSSGKTKSCGCLRGHGKQDNRVVGIRKQYWSEYNVWRSLRQRCLNSNDIQYIDYGGRGIKVCDRWGVFDNFLDDMGKRPQGFYLDREDNNGHYCKENCRWVPSSISATNRRTNTLLTFKGETLCLKAWSTKLNIRYGTILQRLHRKLSVDKILSVNPL